MTKERKGYPSDVSDEEWAFCAPYLTLMKEEALQREHSLRAFYNALRWFVRAGCPWRMMTGLKYSTLAGWRQRYRRGKSKSSPSPVRLLEAVVEPEAAASGKSPLALVAELPGGARLEIGDIKQVPLAAALLRSLHPPC